MRFLVSQGFVKGSTVIETHQINIKADGSVQEMFSLRENGKFAGKMRIKDITREQLARMIKPKSALALALTRAGVVLALKDENNQRVLTPVTNAA